MDAFEVIRPLGRGAFATVSLVKRRRDGALFVSKTFHTPMSDLSKKERDEIAQEIKVLALLNNEGIIKFFDNFVEEGTMHIIMEYAAGGTLHKRIVDQEGALLDEDYIWEIFVQIVHALRYVHRCNVLHRDLKTQNILLSGPQQRVVKLGDFGIAKVLGAEEEAGTIVGTPHYLSPELVQGQTYDHKSDIWALGCVLYELAALRKPFDGSTMPGILFNIMRNRPPPLPKEFSSDLRGMCGLLLQANPEKRPDTHALVRMRIVQQHWTKWRSTRRRLLQPLPVPQARRPGNAAQRRPSRTASMGPEATGAKPDEAAGSPAADGGAAGGVVGRDGPGSGDNDNEDEDEDEDRANPRRSVSSDLSNDERREGELHPDDIARMASQARAPKTPGGHRAAFAIDDQGAAEASFLDQIKQLRADAAVAHGDTGAAGVAKRLGTLEATMRGPEATPDGAARRRRRRRAHPGATGQVWEALGGAWSDVGCFDEAIAAYRRALRSRKSKASLGAMEQLGNLLVRRAQQLWSLQSQGRAREGLAAIRGGDLAHGMMSRRTGFSSRPSSQTSSAPPSRYSSGRDLGNPTPEEPEGAAGAAEAGGSEEDDLAGAAANLMMEGLANLERLCILGETPERQSLLGSAYKRRAWTGMGKDREEDLRRAGAAYGAAHELAMEDEKDGDDGDDSGDDGDAKEEGAAGADGEGADADRVPDPYARLNQITLELLGTRAADAAEMSRLLAAAQEANAWAGRRKQLFPTDQWAWLQDADAVCLRYLLNDPGVGQQQVANGYRRQLGFGTNRRVRSSVLDQFSFLADVLRGRLNRAGAGDTPLRAFLRGALDKVEALGEIVRQVGEDEEGDEAPLMASESVSPRAGDEPAASAALTQQVQHEVTQVVRVEEPSTDGTLSPDTQPIIRTTVHAPGSGGGGEQEHASLPSATSPSAKPFAALTGAGQPRPKPFAALTASPEQRAAAAAGGGAAGGGAEAAVAAPGAALQHALGPGADGGSNPFARGAPRAFRPRWQKRREMEEAAGSEAALGLPANQRLRGYPNPFARDSGYDALPPARVLRAAGLTLRGEDEGLGAEAGAAGGEADVGVPVMAPETVDAPQPGRDGKSRAFATAPAPSHSNSAANSVDDRPMSHNLSRDDSQVREKLPTMSNARPQRLSPSPEVTVGTKRGCCTIM